MRLTVCIPTYNRAAKLDRVIRLFREQIAAAHLAASVELLVSDNASTDATPLVVARAIGVDDGVRVLAERCPENLGMGMNILSLYEAANCDYVWIFSDDDIIYPGAVKCVHSVLSSHEPDILLFSFVQPPGSKARQFDHSEPVRLEGDGRQCVDLVTCYPKISIFLLRKVRLSREALRLIKAHLEHYWFGFFSLPFAVLDASRRPLVATVSQALAGCDEEYVHQFRFPPLDWAREFEVLQHPFITRHAPELASSAEERLYCIALQFAWSWRAGSLDVDKHYVREWWKALGTFPARWKWLRKSKGRLIRFVVLKTFPGWLPRVMNEAAAFARRCGLVSG